VTGTDGKQELVVANAPERIPLQVTPWEVIEKGLPVHAAKGARRAAQIKAVPNESERQTEKQREVVIYSLPIQVKAIHVRANTRVVEVTNAGKTEHQAVEIITVVAQ
jgi:uncharacterized membrane protein